MVGGLNNLRIPFMENLHIFLFSATRRSRSDSVSQSVSDNVVNITHEEFIGVAIGGQIYH